MYNVKDLGKESVAKCNSRKTGLQFVFVSFFCHFPSLIIFILIDTFILKLTYF